VSYQNADYHLADVVLNRGHILNVHNVGQAEKHKQALKSSLNLPIQLNHLPQELAEIGWPKYIMLGL